MSISILLKKEYLWISIFFLLILPVILFFVINYVKKIFFIGKCNKLLEQGKYEVVKNMFAKKSPSLLSKEILKIISNSYLNSGEIQKAIHYLQLMTDLDLIKDDYEFLNNNLILANLLFELNQTTESFNKLIDVKAKGKYNPLWNLLIGKIYLSQNYFEKAIKYFNRALIIDEDYFVAKFYSAVVEYLLTPDYGIKKLMIIKSFYKEPLVEIFEGIYNFSQKNYLKASIMFQGFLKKLGENIVEKSLFIKEEVKIGLNFYLTYLNIFVLIFLILCRFYLSKPFAAELSLIKINVNKILEYNENEFLKYMILYYLICALFIVKENKFFKEYKKIIELKFNKKIDSELFEFEAKKFYKKVIRGYIFIDILLLSLKKPLYVKPNQLKEDFKKFINYRVKSENYKNYIRKFNTLTKQEFIKISYNIAGILGYKVKRHKYIYSRTYKSDGINLKVFKTVPYYHHDLIVIRRFKEYRLGKNYLYFLDDLRTKEKTQTLLLVSNMDFDEDFYNYKSEFRNIKLIPVYKLAFLLESIYTQ